MISLRKREKKTDNDDDSKNEPGSSRPVPSPRRVFKAQKPMAVRDMLLQKEVMELNNKVLPGSVHVRFPDPNVLHKLLVFIKPSEGFWVDGCFEFEVNVPNAYNMEPPQVHCVTPIWHPNISHLQGNVCLSLLRVSCEGDWGWTPSRQLKDVVLGLDALFGDLVNFDDPLNLEAAEDHRKSPEMFAKRVKALIRRNNSVPQRPL